MLVDEGPDLGDPHLAPIAAHVEEGGVAGIKHYEFAVLRRLTSLRLGLLRALLRLRRRRRLLCAVLTPWRAILLLILVAGGWMGADIPRRLLRRGVLKRQRHLVLRCMDEEHAVPLRVDELAWPQLARVPELPLVSGFVDQSAAPVPGTHREHVRRGVVDSRGVRGARGGRGNRHRATRAAALAPSARRS